MSDKYVRYIIKPGTYNGPKSGNKGLYGSTRIKDEDGQFIPTISEGEINATQTNCYIIGICDNTGSFMLSDAASVYRATTNAIQKTDNKLRKIRDIIRKIEIN